MGMLQTSDSFNGMIFKGGTCLRECYFPDYRFSEDLDFTATRHLSPAVVEDWITKSAGWIGDHDGPDFQFQPVHFEIVDDEYGSESYQARVYYRGPLRWGGSPRTVKLDITRAEVLLLPTNERQILHPYSDQGSFSGNMVPCYCLEEVIAEKIRALSGQRRFAISRDLYDIYNLMASDVDVKLVQQILPEKFQIRNLNLKNVDVNDLKQRRFEFEKDWERRLQYLVVNSGVTYETVWHQTLRLMEDILHPG
jgi:predicted nucleotidyltransferase component of viral defense system